MLAVLLGSKTWAGTVVAGGGGGGTGVFLSALSCFSQSYNYLSSAT